MRSTFQLEVKSLDESGSFKGLGSTFGNVDLGGDICQAGCFAKSLSGWGKKGQLPPLLFGHDMNEPIGDWTEIAETTKGLAVKGQLWIGKGIPKSEQAYQLMKGTGPRGLSIGYIADKKSYDPKNNRILEEVSLIEVSVVAFPMNQKAGVTRVKGLRDTDGQPLDPRTVESLLRDELGLSAREAKAFMAEGYRSLTIERDADFSAELDALHKSLHAFKTNINRA